MEVIEHIVRFDEWCKKCTHYKVKDTEEPCNECLSRPVNVSTTKPQLFENK